MFHVEHLKHQNDAAPLNIAAVFPIPLQGFYVIAISGVLRLERNETLLCASYRQTSCVNRISPVPVLSIEIGFAAALFHTFATSSSAALPGNCFT